VFPIRTLDGGPDGRFPGQPVTEVVIKHGRRVFDDLPMTGSDPAGAQTANLFERFKVDGHVAVGRGDHDSRTLHHVITGKQETLPGQFETQMV
jgi:hypothetical protein